MALSILMRDGTKPEWRIGQELVRVNSKDVIRVQADGPELEFLLEKVIPLHG